METPSSTRRVTRSQTLAAAAAANNSANNFSTLRKTEESEIGLTKSRNRNNGKKQQDRSALFDITNESPIIGLAMGSLETPLSSSSSSAIMLSKKRIISPGSGEALLRGQVRTLLQKVEEEAELSKLSLENRPAFLSNNLQGFLNSPLNFIAPTPANTPQIFDFSQTNGLASFSQSPVEDKFLISLQMGSEIFEGKKQESNLMITRSLLQDFSEKSEGYCSSELTYQGGGESEGKKSGIITDDDDSSSIWFIQVNASTVDDGQEVEEEEEEDAEEGLEEDCENDYIYSEGEEEEEKEDEGLVVDELCDAVSKISVNGGEMEKFTGKHTRFVYNSDDELQGGEESASSAASSPSGLKLRGLPTPKGKHVVFLMTRNFV